METLMENVERIVGFDESGEPVRRVLPMVRFHKTPWGPAQHIEDLGAGVARVTTASHVGLVLCEEARAKLPVAVLDSFLNGPQWAEEDCEEAIVLCLLGRGEPVFDKAALLIARSYGRYAAAVPHLEKRLGVEPVKEGANPLDGIVDGPDDVPASEEGGDPLHPHGGRFAYADGLSHDD